MAPGHLEGHFQLSENSTPLRLEKVSGTPNERLVRDVGESPC